jgi:hypothetical protein
MFIKDKLSIKTTFTILDNIISHKNNISILLLKEGFGFIKMPNDAEAKKLLTI